MAENKYKYFINRDLSWLKFNLRVLEEAEDTANPLWERLNFIAIYHSNLTEFLRVRVGSLYDRTLLKKDEIDVRSGMTTKEQLDAVNKEIKKITPRKNAVLLDVLSELENHGVYYRSGKHLTKYEERFLERYFERNVLPLLSPHIIDKHHPFPFLQNDVVYIAVMLKTKSGNTRLGIIPASGYFERLLLLPSKYIKFTLIENLIYLFAARVFPKHKVIDKTIFSVTRNADIDADEAFFEYDMSYRDIMEIMVKKRTKLEPIRLDMIRNDSSAIKKQLLKHLNLDASQCFFNEIPVMLNFVGDLKDALQEEKYSHLFYTPLKPQPSAFIDDTKPLIPQIKRKDLLLSYPYQDIKTYVHLLEEAAQNRAVVSIKITLYRVARNSRIVDALIRAAESGKEVIAVVELRARFDEENNIDWSKRLQESGVSVIYGIEKYKVHSKLMVITIKERNDVSFITQVGTGNYNETTARLYTDLSYITADTDIAINAQDVFKNLCMGSLVETSDLLMVSPLTLKQEVLRLIEKESEIAKTGKPARLMFKLNSISDMDIIQALIDASDAGVKISMIVRGICCLNVEEKGKTRNIEIKSIVGRLLEHARIYVFGEGKRQKVYISSADFMSRNTERRVEVGVPILDEKIKKQLLGIIDMELKDNVKARQQVGGGVYEKLTPKNGEKPLNSQIEQYRAAYEQAGSTFPEDA
ncbi:polyphosphate kinase 1 [Christensenellaceae bacterium OttesenSCG-928-K19]|nr:polyphosphate kinase 1 [Christensenellaceae bacterium OttesenSCG-928-K19]